MKSKRLLPIIIILIILFTFTTTAAQIKVYFTHSDDPESALINQINQAQESIDIAMYYFTDREIAQAVLAAHKRGVKIRIYLDKS